MKHVNWLKDEITRIGKMLAGVLYVEYDLTGFRCVQAWEHLLPQVTETLLGVALDRAAFTAHVLKTQPGVEQINDNMIAQRGDKVRRDGYNEVIHGVYEEVRDAFEERDLPQPATRQLAPPLRFDLEGGVVDTCVCLPHERLLDRNGTVALYLWSEHKKPSLSEKQFRAMRADHPDGVVLCHSKVTGAIFEVPIKEISDDGWREPSPGWYGGTYKIISPSGRRVIPIGPEHLCSHR